MLRSRFSLGLWFLSVSLAGASGSSLTIYNQDFAVVGDTVPLDLHEGVNQIHFADLTAQVEADSVVLRDPSGKNDFRVLEQNYRADFATQALMLSRFEGQTIDFLVQQPQKADAIIAGKIIRSGDDRGGETQPIVEIAGKLRFDLPDCRFSRNWRMGASSNRSWFGKSRANGPRSSTLQSPTSPAG